MKDLIDQIAWHDGAGAAMMAQRNKAVPPEAVRDFLRMREYGDTRDQACAIVCGRYRVDREALIAAANPPPVCGELSPEGRACLYELRKGGKPHKGNHSWYVAPEPVPPTVDEMLEAIAAKLQEDVQTIMLYCSQDEGWLHDMYRRSHETRLSVSPPWR